MSITFHQGVTELDGVSDLLGLSQFMGVSEGITASVSAPSAGYLLMESGDKFILEDASGFILLQ